MSALSFPKAVFTKFSSRSFIVLALVGVLFSLSVIPAFACAAQPSPDSYPKYSLKERIDHVPFVFSGTIMDIEYRDTAVAVVRVTNYFKGSGPEIVRISGFSMGADCQQMVDKFQQAVFFVSGSPDSGFHAASTLDVPNYVKPTEPDSYQLFSDILKATGKEPGVPTEGAADTTTLGLAFGYGLLAGSTVPTFGSLLLYLILLQK